MAVLVVAAGEAHGEPRVLDFRGGYTLTEPADADRCYAVGLLFDVRRYGPGLWVSASVSAETELDVFHPPADDRTVAVGTGAGTFVDLGSRVTLLAGLRLDALTASHWPGATSRTYGVRAGPTASAVVVLGHVWRHPMGIEARVDGLAYDMARGDSRTLWQGGLFVWGVLLPDPPLPAAPSSWQTKVPRSRWDR